MKYYEETLQVCRGYLTKNPHIDKVFEKQGGRNAFLYEYEQEGRRLLSEITVETSESFVILRMESGIRADTEALGITIQACQLCSSPDEPGILMISPDNRYVTYLISSPIVELPVCEETLAWMHTCAFEKITACESFLKMFSQNRLDPQLLAIPKRKKALLPEDLRDTLQFAIEVLNEDFAETDCAAVNMLQSGEDPVLFFNEIRTKDGMYYEKISVDPSGCLIVSVRPAVQIDRLEQGDLAPICNRLNCEQAKNGLLSGLHAFSDDGFLWFSSPISLWDGLIGIEAVKAIENYALRHLDECMFRWSRSPEDLPMEEPEEDENEDERAEIASFLQKYLADDGPTGQIEFDPAVDAELEEILDPDDSHQADVPDPVSPAPMLTLVSGTTTRWQWKPEDSEDTFEIEFNLSVYTDDTSGTQEAGDAKEKRACSDGIDPEPNKTQDSSPNSLDEAMRKHREFKKRMEQLEARLKEETAPDTKPDD